MDLSQLTIGDLEALAARLGAAARTIRDAQSLLGGNRTLVYAEKELTPAEVEASRPRGNEFISPAKNGFDAEELALRAKALKAIRGDDLPDDIKAAEAAR